MNKRLTIIVVTLALAITGINAPAGKARAETEAPSATATPTPTVIGENSEDRFRKTPKLFRVDGDNADGETAKITKGFDSEISCYAYGEAVAKWTSSNPEVISIKRTRQDMDKKTAILTGKNYGKSVVTVECAGYKGSVVITVVKNEYKGKPIHTRESMWYYGKDKGMSHEQEFGPITVKYNKKGKLVIKYTEKKCKWKNPKERAKIVYKGGIYVSIKDKHGKKVIDRTVGNFKMTWSPKKPNASLTFTVPKKYLKKKLVDLRKCTYWVCTNGGNANHKVVR